MLVSETKSELGSALAGALADVAPPQQRRCIVRAAFSKSLTMTTVSVVVYVVSDDDNTGDVGRVAAQMHATQLLLLVVVAGQDGRFERALLHVASCRVVLLHVSHVIDDALERMTCDALLHGRVRVRSRDVLAWRAYSTRDDVRRAVARIVDVELTPHAAVGSKSVQHRSFTLASFVSRIGQLATTVAWRAAAPIDVVDDAGAVSAAPVIPSAAAAASLSATVNFTANFSQFRAQTRREAGDELWLARDDAELRRATRALASADALRHAYGAEVAPPSERSSLTGALDDVMRRAPRACAPPRSPAANADAANATDRAARRCVVCGARRLHGVLDAPALSFDVCRACHHVQTAPSTTAVDSLAADAALACSATTRGALRAAPAWLAWLSSELYSQRMLKHVNTLDVLELVNGYATTPLASMQARHFLLTRHWRARGVRLDTRELVDAHDVLRGAPVNASLAASARFDVVIVHDLLACTARPVDALRAVAERHLRAPDGVVLLYINPEHRAFVRGRFLGDGNDVGRVGARRCSIFNVRSVDEAVRRAHLGVAIFTAAAPVVGGELDDEDDEASDAVGARNNTVDVAVDADAAAADDVSVYFVAVRRGAQSYSASDLADAVPRVAERRRASLRVGQNAKPTRGMSELNVTPGARGLAEAPDDALQLLVRARDEHDVAFFYERYRSRLLAQRAWLRRRLTTLCDKLTCVALVPAASSHARAHYDFLLSDAAAALQRRVPACASLDVSLAAAAAAATDSAAAKGDDAPSLLIVRLDGDSLSVSALRRRVQRATLLLDASAREALYLLAPASPTTTLEEFAAALPAPWPAPQRVPRGGRLVLVSHVCNERFFAPYFVLHHAPLFDAAVFLDYKSSDGTKHLLETLAPAGGAWRVETSRNGDVFAPDAVDDEVIDHEQAMHLHPHTWKLALNVVEFLVTTPRALYRQLAAMNGARRSFFRIQACFASGNDTLPLRPFASLVAQRCQCSLQSNLALYFYRFMHRVARASYSAGRHDWTTQCRYCPTPIAPASLAFLVKFQFSPYPEVRIRLRRMAEAAVVGNLAWHGQTLANASETALMEAKGPRPATDEELLAEHNNMLRPQQTYLHRMDLRPPVLAPQSAYWLFYPPNDYYVTWSAVTETDVNE